MRCVVEPSSLGLWPQVLAGETDGDSAAWGAVLQQMGRSYGDGLYGNMCCGGRMR